MCVAIVKPAGKYLDPDDLVLAHQANSDGCGFTVRRPQGLLTRKGLWTFAEFWHQFEPYQHLEALVHFRWASMGKVTVENCHPFMVTPGLALIHNGHFAGYGSTAKSDTRDWIDETLRPLLTHYPNALDTPILRRLLEASLGQSKVAVMSTTKTYVLGGSKDDWDNGIWYSQREYRKPRSRLVYAYDKDGSLWDTPVEEEAWEEGGLCDFCGRAEATYQVCTPCMFAHEEREEE
jgi:hypothetical protein